MSSLDSVGKAKDMFSDLLMVVDQRIMRIFNRVEAPLKEFSLQFGQSAPSAQAATDSAPAVTGQSIVMAPSTVIVPWDADAFRFRLWTQFGCSLTVTIHRARGTDPSAFAPIMPDSTAAPLLVLEDTLGGDPGLTTAGFQTQLLAGDIISVTPTVIVGVATGGDAGGTPVLDASGNPVLDAGGNPVVTAATAPQTINSYYGCEITCRLRISPIPAPTPGLDSGGGGG